MRDHFAPAGFGDYLRAYRREHGRHEAYLLATADTRADRLCHDTSLFARMRVRCSLLGVALGGGDPLGVEAADTRDPRLDEAIREAAAGAGRRARETRAALCARATNAG